MLPARYSSLAVSLYYNYPRPLRSNFHLVTELIARGLKSRGIFDVPTQDYGKNTYGLFLPTPFQFQFLRLAILLKTTWIGCILCIKRVAAVRGRAQIT